MTTLEEIKKLITLKTSADFSRCVEVAWEIFNYQFDHNIRDLMSIFPKDHLDSHGMPFWSGPKRAPDAIPFDAQDETHLGMVFAMANLVAFNMGLPQQADI